MVNFLTINRNLIFEIYAYIVMNWYSCIPCEIELNMLHWISDVVMLLWRGLRFFFGIERAEGATFFYAVNNL